MFRKILVPLDGTELAEGILPFVSQLAKSPNVSLVLLSVLNPSAAEPPESPPTLEQVEGKVRGHLEGVVKRLGEEGPNSRVALAVGKPEEEIVRIAEKEGCDLVAMSSRGRNPLGRGILGSVTDRVIHSSRLPTLNITPERAQSYWRHGVAITRIIVPLDGSDLAEMALPYVERLALGLSLEVVLVRLVKVGGIYSAHIEGQSYSGTADIEAEVEREAAEYLQGVVKELRGKGLEVQWKVHRGSPAAAIVELAQETPQDIVALASHGRSGLSRWLIDSVAEAVIRASGNPVLVIPPPRDEQKPNKGGKPRYPTPR